jgi:hypothetical protein
VVDATGVGAGLASFLDKAFPHRVIPFIFSAKSKSDLGWDFLSVIETGRYKEYQLPSHKVSGTGCLTCQVDDDLSGFEGDPLQETFWKQAEYCQSAVLDGPGKLLRWGVPDGSRDAATGDLVHDDLLISAALCAALDGQSWGMGASEVITGEDILQGMKEIY